MEGTDIVEEGVDVDYGGELDMGDHGDRDGFSYDIGCDWHGGSGREREGGFGLESLETGCGSVGHGVEDEVWSVEQFCYDVWESLHF